MPPEASGPVFTVRKPIFIGPLWARNTAGAAITALPASIPLRTARRFILMLDPPRVSLPLSHSRRDFAAYQLAILPPARGDLQCKLQVSPCATTQSPPGNVCPLIGSPG